MNSPQLEIPFFPITHPTDRKEKENTVVCEPADLFVSGNDTSARCLSACCGEDWRRPLQAPPSSSLHFLDQFISWTMWVLNSALPLWDAALALGEAFSSRGKHRQKASVPCVGDMWHGASSGLVGTSLPPAPCQHLAQQRERRNGEMHDPEASLGGTRVVYRQEASWEAFVLTTLWLRYEHRLVILPREICKIKSGF